MNRLVLRALVVAAMIITSVFVPQELAWSAPETRMAKSLDASSEKIVPVNFPTTHAVVSWKGEATASLEFRGQTRGAWSEWQVVNREEATAGGDPTRHQSSIMLVDDATKLQVRVLDGNAYSIEIFAMDTKHGPRQLVAKSSTEPAAALYGQTPAPTIISRAQWGANESIRRGEPEFAPINRIIIHHTASPNTDSDPAATVRGIYGFHVNGNGWNDIGYNFLIDRQGRVYEGRYARGYYAGEVHSGEDANGNGVIGAHAMNANTGSVGISLIGTYDSVPPTSAQQEALKRLVAWKADLHNLDTSQPGVMVGHRQVYATSCPGDAASALLPSWGRAANAIRASYDIPRSIPGNVPGSTPGYWITGVNGSVTRFGEVQDYGSMAGKSLNQPVTGMVRTPQSKGYWLLGGDGGIFSFGDAQFYGSMGGQPLNMPVVDLAPTPTGKGYWLVASDGGIFAFGDAQFYGSMGGRPLNKPVVGIASSPTGKGYWLVASDGGIFAFGDAEFRGSMGGKTLNRPVSGITRPANANGYWLFAEDGGVFTFGDIDFYGSIPSLHLTNYAGTTQAIVTASSRGYYVLSRAGAVYSFGDARFWGAGVPGGAAAGIAVAAN